MVSVDLRKACEKRDTAVARRHSDNTSANLPSQTNLPTICASHASSGSFSDIFRNKTGERKGGGKLVLTFVNKMLADQSHRCRGRVFWVVARALLCG